MSGLLYTLLGLAASSSLHCAVRREISPCTCRQQDFSTPVVQASTAATIATDSNNNGNNNENAGIPIHGHNERIEVVCERMESFGQVVEALRGKFTADQQITLTVAHSQLKDISSHDFEQLRMSITKLHLNYDYLSFVDHKVFAGLNRTQYLSLADNEMPSLPRHILSHLSLLRTLDLSRNRISRIDSDDFKYNQALQFLILAGNSISEMVPGSLPPLIKQLHVGRNHLKTLNRTLRDLNQLEWLLIHSNELTSLDGELPASGHNLKMLYVPNNQLTHLPAEFRYLHRLESLFLQHNKIRSLDGTLRKAKCLKYLELSYNELQELTEDDFVEAELLEELNLGHNSLKSLGGGSSGLADGSTGNSALWPLTSLKTLNLTHNELSEFSFGTLRGLKELRLIDLSSNRISRLLRGRPPTENLVEEEGEETAGTSIQELQLQHNKLRSLEGSLFVGMRGLQRLNLSHNALGQTIGPQVLRGLDALRVLDLSHNNLETLEDASETWLPSLEELIVSHNRLVVLTEGDFRGFPILCWADVSANQIRFLAPELVANTRCTVHGVPDVLRIFLQDNPVLCDAGLTDLTVALEVNHAKIYGVANDCPITTKTPTELTSPRPPLPQTIFHAAAAAASGGGNVSFAATLE